MQLSLTNEQILKLEASGVAEVKKQLEAGKFGSYRRQLIENWVAATEVLEAKIRAAVKKQNAPKKKAAKKGDTDET